MTDPIPAPIKNYIAEKLKTYVEPNRQGTPKGEQIGMSLKKYHVSLLVALVVDRGLKTIHEQYGKKIGFSYGLLRKWSTEEKFRKAVVSHRLDYLANDYMRTRHSFFYGFTRNQLICSCLEIAITAMHNKYSSSELKKIGKHIQKIADIGTNFDHK